MHFIGTAYHNIYDLLIKIWYWPSSKPINNIIDESQKQTQNLIMSFLTEDYPSLFIKLRSIKLNSHVQYSEEIPKIASCWHNTIYIMNRWRRWKMSIKYIIFHSFPADCKCLLFARYFSNSYKLFILFLFTQKLMSWKYGLIFLVNIY